jgi:hypothetical protein
VVIVLPLNTITTSEYYTPAIEIAGVAQLGGGVAATGVSNWLTTWGGGYGILDIQGYRDGIEDIYRFTKTSLFSPQ